jgi:glycosyltransferase involved in cell wall biosynthesis
LTTYTDHVAVGGLVPRKIALGSTAVGRGGLWRHIEDLGLGLQRAGLEVTVGLLPSATVLHEACQRAGLPWEPLHRTVRPGIDLWHLHLHDTYDRRALMALAARRLAGPAVITEHLPRSNASDGRLDREYPHNRYADMLKTVFKRVELGLAHGVIAVSASSARFLEERYSLVPGAVTIVHNGVTTPHQPAAPRRSDGRLRVVAVGSFGRQKGFDVLLEAMRISLLDWEVVLVGTGPQRERLYALASNVQPERVRFTGWVDDPRPYLLAADVVCMPSRWESFPYAALEACASSRPVVGSRVDGLDEIVANGESGILVEPEDPRDLAAALDRLAANPMLAAEFGRAAYARVRKRFDLDTMVDKVIAAYARACGAPIQARGIDDRPV